MGNEIVIKELDQQLASLNQLKAPGASKGKIGSITQLCVSNIQVEQSIVQSLYLALKKAPATHKLGALYVIDSVTRQWIEKAKQNGQELNFEGRGEAGTFSAAVKRVTELIPALFDDIMKGVSQEQKPKLVNMIGIWEKGNTFPAKLLADFKAKLSSTNAASAPPRTNGTTTTQSIAPRSTADKFVAPIPTRPLFTPLGYPPQQLYDQGYIVKKTAGDTANGIAGAHSRPPPSQQAFPQSLPAVAAPQPPTQDVNNILAMLANAAPKPAAPPPSQFMHQAVPPPGLPPNIAALFGQQNGAPPNFQQPPGFSAAPAATPMQIPGFQLPQGFSGFPGYPPQPPPSIPQTYPAAPPPQLPAPADPLAPLRGILPPKILNDQGKLVMALNLLQDLQKQGLPMDQWAPILQAFDDAQGPSQSDGHDAYSRRRSRSPERGGGKGRASPVYGAYGDVASRNNGEDQRVAHGNNGGRGRYRQRSPIQSMRDLPMRDSPGPTAMNGHPMQPKYIAIDSSLPHDNIKVLSRTLFVGGANGSQAEIHQLFERFGRVQTCIANRDKRHAFVKMTTRNHALSAKAGMEDLQSRNDRDVMNIARQTKWGVGFGPRECCNYTTGESTIPITKLTDADVKWLTTAEYGGTGGKQLEGGMVLEEPDIEIGAGVSSKAMSKRVLPESGLPPPPSAKRQKEGVKHHRKQQHDYDREPGSNYGGYSGVTGGAPPQPMESYGYDRLVRQEAVAVATPPAVPTFGFSLPGQPGYR
ncbi:hypothetical protein LTR02_002589 [Friedmanniomyces endolithicus]|nr:hypothetical protein LTR94_016191 [Friedmanniomyces endolithicus]KAK0798169.1 hypothetical protein LTR38_007959 [Friedmanniomyces endolithicus]KAK0805418.1 hypothetical protein LTR59_003972 [Friedmanniomyces endolithicus]KAK0811217.1 hypothetical protein LTR75_005305 [Friedmanniomyces endolithicus]KAK0844676.1 hypothetical protein LTS02_015614 [Friedmanniomyces endolithicus]